ncbi:MAG: hypothetical protein QXZ43_03885 [Candidatus Aenigmatarchaeota archaeon]
MNIAQRALLGITVLDIAFSFSCVPRDAQRNLYTPTAETILTQTPYRQIEKTAYPSPFPTVTPENFTRDYLRTDTATATQTVTVTLTVTQSSNRTPQWLQTIEAKK